MAGQSSKIADCQHHYGDNHPPLFACTDTFAFEFRAITVRRISLREDFCAGRNPNVATLQVFADDEHSYLLPYAQFLYAEMTPNPALEKQMDAPAQKLVICFAAAEVTVLGAASKLSRGRFRSVN